MEALLLFLRWPTPGRTKTRLIPALGAEGAARLYRRLAERVADVVRDLERPHLTRYAYFEPVDRESEVAAWMGEAFTPLAQPDADLGPRLVDGFDRAFAAGAERVVAIGSDCVEITPGLLADALDALRTHDAVVGPATDGGYWTIGLARPCPDVFADVPFSSEVTLAATLDRMAEAGLSVASLPTLSDVDRPEDLDGAARPLTAEGG
jgi:rSAM/selenodomain-associated transferase 1